MDGCKEPLVTTDKIETAREQQVTWAKLVVDMGLADVWGVTVRPIAGQACFGLFVEPV